MATACNAKIKKVSDVLKMNLRLPNYQRSYKWTQRNVTELLDDIAVCIASGDCQAYRVGSVILHTHDNEFNVVDGQQRLLTFILISLALDPDFTCSLTDDARYCQTLAYDKVSQENLHENYRIIREYLTAGGEEFQVAVRRALSSTLEMVVISVGLESEAFQLFDSQNTRGRRLDPHDLLKAYHLREMRDRYAMKHAVVKWESVDSRAIRDLFNFYLYPISRWIQREKCGGFTERQIDLFKGVPSRTEYGYGHRVVKAMPCYQLGEQFEAGEHFFSMVDYYLKMREDVETEIRINPELSKIRKVLDAEEEDSGKIGFAHAKRLFYCAVMCYFDRFANFDIRAITKICLWAFMIRIDMEKLGFDTINKYALGEDVYNRYSNHYALFSLINHARSHQDIANLAIQRNSDDSELSKALAEC